MELGVLISQQELIGRRTSMKRLSLLMRKLSLADVLFVLAGWARRLEKGEGRQLDIQVASKYPVVGKAVLREIALGRPLIFPTRLAAVAKLALEHADRRAGDEFGGSRLDADFAEIVVGVVDHFAYRGANKEERILSLMLQQVARPDAHLATSVARYHRLLVDLPGIHPDLDDAKFDLRVLKRNGQSITRQLALAFAIWVKFHEDSLQDHWQFGSEFLVETGLRNTDISPIQTAMSGTPDDLRQEIVKERSAGYGAPYDLRPFSLKPICEIEPGRFVPVHLGAISERLLSDGLYWRVRYLFQSSDAQKTAFGKTMGAMLEEHCAEVLDKPYPRAQRHVGRLYREHRYGAHDGADFAIFEGDRAAFIEVGTDRPNWRDVLDRGDVDAYRSDIELLLRHRIEQLDRKISHFRAGQLCFEGQASVFTSEIYPVICLLDGFPTAPRLRDEIDLRIRAWNLLAGLPRLTIISTEELEMLAALVRTKRVTMSNIIAGYTISSERDEPIRNYLLSTFGDFRDPFMSSESERVMSLVKSELFARKSDAVGHPVT